MSMFTVSDPPALIAHGSMGGVGAWHLFDQPCSSSQPPASNKPPEQTVHVPFIPPVIRTRHEEGGDMPMQPLVVAQSNSARNQQWETHHKCKPFERLSYLQDQLAGYSSLQSSSSLSPIPHDLLIDILNQDIDDCITDWGKHGSCDSLLDTLQLGREPDSHLVISAGGGPIGDHVTLTLLTFETRPSEAAGSASRSVDKEQGSRVRSLQCSEVSVGREVLQISARPLSRPIRSDHAPDSLLQSEDVLIAARCGYCVNVLRATHQPSQDKPWRMEWLAICTPSPSPSPPSPLPAPPPRTSHVSWCPLIKEMAITMEDGSIFVASIPPLSLPRLAPQEDIPQDRSGALRVNLPSVMILGPWGRDHQASSLPPPPPPPSSISLTSRTVRGLQHPPSSSSTSSSTSGLLLSRSGPPPPRSCLMTLQGIRPRVLLCAQGPHLFTLPIPNLPQSVPPGSDGTAALTLTLTPTRPTLVFTLPCEDRASKCALGEERSREMFTSFCLASPSSSPSSSSSLSSSSYASHLVALGTTERILLIDMRAPKTPLMQWKIDPAIIEPMQKLGPMHLALTLISSSKDEEEGSGPVLGSIYYSDQGGSLMSLKFTLSPPRYELKVDHKSRILVRADPETTASQGAHASSSSSSSSRMSNKADSANLSPAMRVLSRVAANARSDPLATGWRRPICFASRQSQDFVKRVDQPLGLAPDDCTRGMSALFTPYFSSVGGRGGGGGGQGGLMHVLRCDGSGRIFAQAFDVEVKDQDSALIQVVRGVKMKVESATELPVGKEAKEGEGEEAKGSLTKERSWSGFILLPCHMTHLSAMMAAAAAQSVDGRKRDEESEQIRPAAAVSSVIRAATMKSKQELEYHDPWEHDKDSPHHDWGLNEKGLSSNDPEAREDGDEGGEGRELAVDREAGTKSNPFPLGSEDHLALLVEKASCPLTAMEINSRLLNAPLLAAALSSLNEPRGMPSTLSDREADWLLLTGTYDIEPNQCSSTLPPLIKKRKTNNKGDAFHAPSFKNLLSVGTNRALLRLVVMDGGWTASAEEAEGRAPAAAAAGGGGGGDELGMSGTRRGERKSSIVENEKRSRLLATLACPWRLLTLPDPPSNPVANEAGTSSSSQPLSGTPSQWVQEMRREERTKLMLKELVSRGRDDERGKTKAHGSVAYGLHQLFASRAVPEEAHARAMDINAKDGGGGAEGGQEEEEEAGPSNRPPTQPPSRTPLPSSWRSGAMDLHLSLPSGPLGSENDLFMKELADSWPIEHELDDLIEGAMARSNDIGIKMKVRWSREESAPLNPPADIPQQSPRLLFTSSEPKVPPKRAKRRRAGEIEP